MRQRRWLELIKDFEVDIQYHLGKANVVADALSRKRAGGILASLTSQPQIQKDLVWLGVEVIKRGESPLCSQLTVQPTLLDKIKDAQLDDPQCIKVKEEMKKGGTSEYFVNSEGLLKFRDRVCVPPTGGLRKEILSEAHTSKYSIHPGSTKMYRDLREHFWWNGMKRDIADYVAQCITCQQVKIEHQRPAGKLQPLSIPEWKWERITMDFVSGLPRSRAGNDAVWVVVDRLTKSAHFIPMKMTFSLEKLTQLYIKEIVRLHGVPISIVSDRDPHFVSKFWGSLHAALGTNLNFSSAYHPQTDGQSERTIQTLEDMLRACALDWKGNWDEYLALAEFAYNNSYHSSLGVAPFEALYGRKCRSPVCWYEVGERSLLGPELVVDASEKIQVIRQRLLTAQSRQKSYADTRRRDLEFNVGDMVFLKVSPWKGVIRFGRKGKLSPRYIGPFEVLEKIGVVAYRLALPPRLAAVHNVFHISMLRKYVHNPNHIIDYEPLQVRDDMTYEERPLRILDSQEKLLRNKTIKMVKVLWSNHMKEEATWELEEEMRKEHSHLFL